MNTAYLNIYHAASEAVCRHSITDGERRTLLRSIRPFKNRKVPTHFWFGAGKWPPREISEIMGKIAHRFDGGYE